MYESLYNSLANIIISYSFKTKYEDYCMIKLIY